MKGVKARCISAWEMGFFWAYTDEGTADTFWGKTARILAGHASQNLRKFYLVYEAI